MRKALLLVLVLLLTVFCACATADTEYTLDRISGRITFTTKLEGSFVVLTPDNLSAHPDMLSSIGKTAEELQADWAERGVVLQAWGKNMNTVVQSKFFNMLPFLDIFI